jgi:outer membrane protein with beta-barrel domain
VKTAGVAIASAAAILLATSASAAGGAGFAVDAQVGYNDLTSASKSAKAVFDGSSGGLTYGGGVRYGFRSRFFVAAWGRVFSKDGQRVFVADATSPVFPLGHPLKIRLVPLQATFGYRFGTGSVTPYVGAGGGVTLYHEESDVAGVVESNDQTKASGHLLAGVEIGRGSLRFATEAAWTFVPNTIGLGGVSKVYGETDVGGFSFVGKVVFSFGRD